MLLLLLLALLLIVVLLLLLLLLLLLIELGMDCSVGATRRLVHGSVILEEERTKPAVYRLCKDVILGRQEWRDHTDG